MKKEEQFFIQSNANEQKVHHMHACIHTSHSENDQCISAYLPCCPYCMLYKDRRRRRGRI